MAEPSPEAMSQAKPTRRGWQLEFLRQMPHVRFSSTREANFQLLPPEKIREVLHDMPSDIVEKIIADMQAIEHDHLRLFRERDYEAAEEQNRYRLYQLGYMLLATLATFFGSLQAVLFGTDPKYVALFAFAQTVIAGLSTFLSFISTREPPFQRWMENRRRAEFLRREYFRYLVSQPPYNDRTLRGFQRERLLAKRAAEANNGVYPSED